MAYCRDNLLFNNLMTYYIKDAVNSKLYKYFHDMNIEKLTLKIERKEILQICIC